MNELEYIEKLNEKILMLQSELINKSNQVEYFKVRFDTLKDFVHEKFLEKNEYLLFTKYHFEIKKELVNQDDDIK